MAARLEQMGNRGLSPFITSAPLSSAPRLSILLLQGVAVLVIEAGVCKEAIAKNEYAMAVTLAPEVKRVTGELSVNDKKRLRSALKTGNRFITARYSMADYPDHSDYWAEWERNIGPLMASNVTQWADAWEREGWTLEVALGGTRGVGMLLSCPSVELTRVELGPERTVLHYRSVLLGVATTGGRPRVLETGRGDLQYLVEVDLNRSNRIAAIHTSQKAIAVNYQFFLNYETRGLRRWDGIAPDRLTAKKKEELDSAKHLMFEIEDAAKSCTQVSDGWQ